MKMVTRTLGKRLGRSQGLCHYETIQKMWENIHITCWFRSHDPSMRLVAGLAVLASGKCVHVYVLPQPPFQLHTRSLSMSKTQASTNRNNDAIAFFYYAQMSRHINTSVIEVTVRKHAFPQGYVRLCTKRSPPNRAPLQRILLA